VSVSLSAIEVVAVLAGMGAGAVNAIIGSGSLITFPTLVACGFPPVVANVSNNIGLVPGSLAGVIGYRRELVGQATRARTLALGSTTGAIVGATLLLRLPSDVFEFVVPVLVTLAVVLLALQPRLTTWSMSRRRAGARDVGVAPLVVTFLAGIYGGYFGAAQGIILVAALGVLVPDALPRTNALKNVLSGCVNAAAAVLFVFFADVSWLAVVLIALGSAVGGTLGARYGRRVPSRVLRPVIVVYGAGVAAYLLLR
jgi:uncharacterized membrane protein YfcA